MVLAQLHEKPSCSPNMMTGLVWANGTQEFETKPDGSLVYAAEIEGYTLTYTISGNTKSLVSESVFVSDFFSRNDALTLFTNGIGKNPITVTIDVFPPIEGDIGMSFFNINKTGNKRIAGDQLSISASYQGENPVYPKFTSRKIKDYTTDEERGILDATASNFSNNQVAGANWYDVVIDQISIVWEDCSTCDREFHSIAIGNLDFCSYVNAGTFEKNSIDTFVEGDIIHIPHSNDYNNSETHIQTYALTDSYGNILDINSEPIFSMLPEGEYLVYAINYQKGEIFANYTNGENISSLIGPYYHMIEKSFQVSAFKPIEEEYEIDINTITMQNR